jgi:hypothetical protein|nr:MAG TPA: hypothetical protein [Caudoviricetes sp.]
MEEKINIAKILKNKPEKTILYDAMRDINVSLYVVEKRNGETNIFCDGMEKFKGCSFVYSDTGADSIFRKGMQLLKPSKEMQDWDKFSWKRGDVLISDCGFVCIFKEWASYDYTKFNGCYFDGMPNAETAKYSKLDNNTAYGYIREIENRCGGKLNLETLKIEKQTEFKDGDVVVTDAVPSLCYSKCIFILKGDFNTGESCANSYIFYNINNNDFCFDVLDTEIRDRNIHLATEEEKQHLFDALAKKGKTWDAEKKQIVDLKPKVELKPFDRVLVRDSKSDNWRANLFGNIGKDGYYRCVYANWVYCIPYAGNEHLLGTTKDVEG